MTPAPLLELRRVVKRRGGRDRRFELSVPALSLAAGQVLALTGPSGCGKSTLIDLLALALAPDAAERFALRLEGGDGFDVLAAWQDGRHEALARARAAGFGYVLQTGGLLGFLSVRQNIALPAAILGARVGDRVEDLALRLGIAPLLDERPERLSVGQRQRVAIARAIAARPPVVLADEPTAALDPGNAETVMRLLLELAAQEGVGLVLATHDRAMAAAFGLPLAGFALSETASGLRAELTGVTA